jgi:cytochrome c-type biogenesis protein CcmF
LVAPERRVYGRTRQPSAEVAILSTILPRRGELRRIGEDFYVIPTNIDLNSNQATIEIIIHPLINWLWLGGVVLLVGTLIALWPERRESSRAPALVAATADAAS